VIDGGLLLMLIGIAIALAPVDQGAKRRRGETSMPTISTTAPSKETRRR